MAAPTSLRSDAPECQAVSIKAGGQESQISLGEIRKTDHRGHGGAQRNIKRQVFSSVLLVVKSISSVVKFIEILVSDDFAILLDSNGREYRCFCASRSHRFVLWLVARGACLLLGAFEYCLRLFNLLRPWHLMQVVRRKRLRAMLREKTWRFLHRDFKFFAPVQKEVARR